MRIGVIGINHKSAPLELRERVARGFLSEFGEKKNSFQGILLSTCNRTELYFCPRSLPSFLKHLARVNITEAHIEILSNLKKSVEGEFEYALYSYFGQDCFNHLGRVISGVDSAIFGESDIQRQAKIAYQVATKKNPLSHELHYLFQKGLKIGKDMRSSFLLAQKDMSLSHAIHSILEWNIKSLPKAKVLFIGNSTINRKLINFFGQLGYKEMTLCTRMTEGDLPKIALGNWDILENWEEYDVVISATYHDDFILKSPRKEIKDTLLFDLSIPRTIDPKLSKHPRLKLYNIDQIGQIAHIKRGGKEIALCDKIIENAVSRQIQLFKKGREAKWRHAASS